MKVELLAEHIGAEITDISIDSLDESQINEIKQAWLKHKVLVFRDQDISIKSHIEFGKLFGDLEIHPDQIQNLMQLSSYNKIRCVFANRFHGGYVESLWDIGNKIFTTIFNYINKS